MPTLDENEMHMRFERPGTLSGPHIVLEPWGEQHREPLRWAAETDASIWTYFPIGYNGAGDRFDEWFDHTTEQDASRIVYPFAVRIRETDRIAGTTRFYEMSPEHRRLGIGSTWYAGDVRGTLVNFEVRLLTLTFAFERLMAKRVEMVTDPANLVSQAAIRILGAVEEGRIRNHLIYPDGRSRDSLLYSILDDEWPAVRDRLSKRLGYGSGSALDQSIAHEGSRS
jgi:RimJ/RimL family protein N-acetyltransferase